MTKKLQPHTEYYLQFTDEECAKLNIKTGDRFSVKESEDGAITFTPFAKLELDLAEFDRTTLEFLITQSGEKDISINDVLTEVLEREISNPPVD